MEDRLKALSLAVEAWRPGEDVVETARRFLAFLENTKERLPKEEKPHDH